jgi:hypothetical protein
MSGKGSRVARTNPVSGESVWILCLIFLSSFGIARSFGNYTFVALFSYGILALGLFIFLGAHVAFRELQFNWLACSLACWKNVLFILFFLELNFLFYHPHLVHSKTEFWPHLKEKLHWLSCGFGALLLPLLSTWEIWFSEKVHANVSQIARWALTGLAIFTFISVLFVSPDPKIDVFVFQQEAAQALVKGLNPYEIQYTNVYPEYPNLYPGGVAKFYPYPPLSFLFTLTSLITSDVRWAYLFCHFAAGWVFFLWTRQKKISLEESFFLSFIFLLIPGALYLIERSWTEPSLVLALVLTAYFLEHSQKNQAALCLGFALALKQTMVMTIPLLLILKEWFWINKRQLFLLTVLPVFSYGIFLIWNASALYEDLVYFHRATPFRPDALTISSWLYRQGLSPLSQRWSFLGLFSGVILSGLVLLKYKKHMFFWLGLAGTYLLTLLFSKHAFYNYYYMVHGLLMIALISTRVHKDSNSS